MTSFTRIAGLALLGTTLAAGAFAQDNGPRVVGSGENASVEYAQPSSNIVGGALVRVIGAGEGAVIEVLEVQTVQAPRSSAPQGLAFGQGSENRG